MLSRERLPGLPIGLLERIKGLPRWVWFIAAIAILPPLSAPVAGLARYTTTSSEYCLSCHGKGDTPDRGLKSLVHPAFDRVTCVDCHAKAGQIVFEGYVKGFMAEPERVSANCMRCHQPMTLRNDTQGFKFNFLDINVTHQSHLTRGATCTTCHSTVAHDLQVPETNRPRMETCNQCHAVAESCAKCHARGVPAAPLPVPAPERAGLETDGRVLYLRTCSGCHGPKGDRVEKSKLNSGAFLEVRGDEALFKDIAEGHGVMPGFSVAKGGTLSDEQVRAIVAHLKVLASAPSGPINAQAIFESRCMVCHGRDGNKMEGIKLGDPDFLEQIGDAVISKAIADGRAGMPGFGREEGGPLEREEIKALLDYLKALGKRDKAVPAEQARELYQKYCASCHGDRGDALPSANLASRSFLEGRGQGELARATSQGRGGMPALGSAKGGPLSDEQVAAIVQFLQSMAK